jgi:hypothetical protein
MTKTALLSGHHELYGAVNHQVIIYFYSQVLIVYVIA